MRLMSFAMTADAFLSGRKTVTRRLGWRHLRAGERLVGVEKAQGLKKGEQVRRLGVLEVVSVRREPLRAIRDEVDGTALEGLPELDTDAFVALFTKAMRCGEDAEVARIGFRRVAVCARCGGPTRTHVWTTGRRFFEHCDVCYFEGPAWLPEAKNVSLTRDLARHIQHAPGQWCFTTFDSRGWLFVDAHNVGSTREVAEVDARESLGRHRGEPGFENAVAVLWPPSAPEGILVS